MTLTTRRQNTLVILFAFMLVGLTVLLTLYLSSAFYSEAEPEGAGYRNVTYTDAVLSCRDNAALKYGERIKNLVTDDHSSRFDNRVYMYKIFLKMDLYDHNSSLSRLHYISCFVRANSGEIRKYDVLKDDEETQPVDDDTNMFGMPLKNKNK